MMMLIEKVSEVGDRCVFGDECVFDGSEVCIIY